MSVEAQLHQLHDAYTWQVNAAVGENRMDLVWELADQYMDDALQLVASSGNAVCGRPGCRICTGSDEPSQPPPELVARPPRRPPVRRRGWWSRLWRA